MYSPANVFNIESVHIEHPQGYTGGGDGESIGEFVSTSLGALLGLLLGELLGAFVGALLGRLDGDFVGDNVIVESLPAGDGLLSQRSGSHPPHSAMCEEGQK